MPPKAKITREMIIDAGFEIVREFGIENVNARTVAQRLGCSTQPVMYHFKTIRDIKRAIYQKADEYHTTYITNIQDENPMLAIGLSYIRFAQFKYLFLFVHGYASMFANNSLEYNEEVISIDLTSIFASIMYTA